MCTTTVQNVFVWKKRSAVSLWSSHGLPAGPVHSSATMDLCAVVIIKKSGAGIHGRLLNMTRWFLCLNIIF
jgi:hypothetical protein